MLLLLFIIGIRLELELFGLIEFKLGFDVIGFIEGILEIELLIFGEAKLLIIAGGLITFKIGDFLEDV